MSKFLLALILTGPLLARISFAGECGPTASHRAVVSAEMRGFWSTFSVAEQASVAATINRFWTHAIRHSHIPRSENLSIFTGLMEFTFGSKIQIQSVGWDASWLKQFLRDLETHPDTDESIRAELREIQRIVGI